MSADPVTMFVLQATKTVMDIRASKNNLKLNKHNTKIKRKMLNV